MVDILDDVDLAIINALKENAKLGIREISRMLRKSPSTIINRVRRLERLGVIKGYTALVDYSKLGYQINAITLLQVDGAHIEEVEKILASEPNVRSVYDITGEYDVMIISTFEDMSKLDAFIKKLLKLPYVKKSVTNIAFRVVKESPHINIRIGS